MALHHRKRSAGDRIVFIPISSIRPNPDQPRRHFEPAALEELADSIRALGILQPLTVRQLSDGWELVAGERRLRAAALAGLEQVPCISVRVDSQNAALLAVVENLQRQDLDFLEEALALDKLLRSYCLSQDEVARRIGKSQSAVANKLRLLRHSFPVLQAIREAELTERHARALLKLPTETDKLKAIVVMQKNNMSVARAEEYIEQLLTQPGEKPMRADVGLFLRNVNQTLARIQKSGIRAISERRETDSQIVLTITIPK